MKNSIWQEFVLEKKTIGIFCGHRGRFLARGHPGNVDLSGLYKE